jgi:hypothetical protein
MMSSQVLDFEGGGDLLNLLVERDTFDEEFTKFYIAEVGPEWTKIRSVLTRAPLHR